jgi:hypothetical protein
MEEFNIGVGKTEEKKFNAGEYVDTSPEKVATEEISKTESIDALIDVLEKLTSGGLYGSDDKLIPIKDLQASVRNTVEHGISAKFITNTAGLRAKVLELKEKERGDMN